MNRTFTSVKPMNYWIACIIFCMSSCCSEWANGQCTPTGADSTCGPLVGGLTCSNLVFCPPSTLGLTLTSDRLVDSACVSFGDGTDTLILHPPLSFTLNHFYNIIPQDSCPAHPPLTITINANFYKCCAGGCSVVSSTQYASCKFRPHPRFTVGDTLCLGDSLIIPTPNSNTGCINATSVSNSGNYHWNYGDGSPLVDFMGVTYNHYLAPPAHLYLTAGTYIVTLSADNICGSASYSHSVVVASINGVSYTPHPICSNNIITANLNSSNGGKFHVSSVSGPSGWQILKNDTTHPQFIFSQAGMYIIHYSILTSPYICDYIDTIIVSVGPNIVHQDILDSCINVVHSLDLSQHFSTNVPNQRDSFKVTLNGNTIFTFDSLGIPITAIPTNQVGLYVVYLIYSTACDTLHIIDSFWVEAPIDSVYFPSVSCADTVNSIVYTSTGSNSYDATVSPNTGVSIIDGHTANPRFAFTVPGSYTVRFTKGGCYIDKQITITVSANITYNGAALPTGCSLGQDSFRLADYYTTNNITSQTTISSLYRDGIRIDSSNMPGISTTYVYIGIAGTYHLNIWGITSCDTIFVSAAFVIDTATTIHLPADTQVCLQTNFILPASNGAQVLLNGQPYLMPTIYIDSMGTYRFAYIPLCGDTVYFTIIGIGTIAYAQPLVACHNAISVTLPGLPSGGTFADSGHFVTGNQMNVTAAGTGIHPYTYTYISVIFGHTCPYTTMDTVFILDTISKRHVLPHDGCIGNAIVILNQSGNNLSVNYGDGGGWVSSLSHVYGQSGIYIISMIFGIGACADTVYDSIQIHPQPQASLSMSSYNLCYRESQIPIVTSIVTPQDTVRWRWRGVIYVVPPIISGDNDSPYVTTEWIYLEVHSAFCGNALDSHAITMFPWPRTKAGLNYAGHCSPLAVSFVNTSVVPIGTRYIWFLNGQVYSTDSFPPSTLLTADTVTRYYTFVLAAITHCDTVYDTVVVYVDPPRFRIAIHMTDTIVCQNVALHFANDMPYHYTLTYYLSSGSVFTTHGDTTISYYYSQPGTYRVMVVVSNGCTDTAYQTVVILPIPLPAPTVSGGTCLDSLVLFNSGTTSGSITSITWGFGDNTYNNTDLYPMHVFPFSGNYRAFVLITDNNHCQSDTAFFNVQITRAPKASFQGDITICEPVDLILQGITYPDTGIICLFLIAHDNEVDSTESLSAQLHFYNKLNGVYSITLLVMDEIDQTCSTLVGTYQIKVIDTPVANFSVKLLPNQEIGIRNNSTGAQSYFWDFGDGSTSIDKSPNYHFEHSDNYMLQLIASNLFCFDTFAKLVSVEPAPFLVPTAFSPNNDGWNDYFKIFGDLNAFETFNIQILDRWGEIEFTSNSPTFKWDGKHKGSIEAIQVFTYIIRFKYKIRPDDEEIRSGNVTLVR